MYRPVFPGPNRLFNVNNAEFDQHAQFIAADPFFGDFTLFNSEICNGGPSHCFPGHFVVTNAALPILAVNSQVV